MSEERTLHESQQVQKTGDRLVLVMLKQQQEETPQRSVGWAEAGDETGKQEGGQVTEGLMDHHKDCGFIANHMGSHWMACARE